MRAPDAGTIMIVDDTPANLSYLSDALNEVGYRVLVAVDGHSAIRQLQHVTPDLILLDVVMPGIDGFETCRRLKDSGATRDIPIVFMTALDGTDNIVRGFGIGAVDYVTKPISQEEVLARVATRLRCSRAIQQFQGAVEANGDAFVVLDAEVRITLVSPPARRLLTHYLGCEVDVGGLLPEVLRGWLASPAAAGAAQVPAGGATWITDRGGTCLAIQATTCMRTGSRLLILKEHERRAPSAETLADTFGLTEREAEVILWVAKGKTNRDISLILSMSPRTVNKHLEHIYIKLGVETRTAAANPTRCWRA